MSNRKFDIGDLVRKTKGSSWHGRVVGFYSTDLTPIGYNVESIREPGSVQLYPEAALEAVSSIHEAPTADKIYEDIDDPNKTGLASLMTDPAPISKGVKATHRHKKRGSEYVLIGIGKMQAEDWLNHLPWNVDEQCYPTTPVDMHEVAIYRSIDDGSLWVRPIEEFNDGRFEALSHTAGEP